MDWYIIGIVAALLTTFGFIPQIIKICKSKSSNDVSFITLLQFGLGTGLWTLYGYYIKDLIVIVANTVSFITIIIAIIFYFRYKG